ncbi:hypothetical protein [Streptomyces sp. NPDC005181]|uniref:hypothetical protein n=1 Tax=Streptomyces sp. NPDC005181 TaxID=3156869 RepID=UPI0033AA6CAA
MEPTSAARPASAATPAPGESGRQSEEKDRFLRTLRSMHGTYRLDDTYASAPLWTAIGWFIGSAGPLDAEILAAGPASDV